MMEQRSQNATYRFQASPHLLAGIVLIAVWWTLAWSQIGSISHYYFFPLWLGYILVVDALVYRRTGTSPAMRLGWRYALVFVISAPFWWMFEAFNRSLENWSYITPWDYGFVGRTIIGSFSFSTVIPAVLATAELVHSYLSPSDRRADRRFGTPTLLAVFISGWLMLGAMVVWPSYLFPLCWISILFIVDPLARFAGATSVSSFIERGDRRPLYSLAISGLICGWFWEMWNFLAMPKWVYSVPHVGFFQIWEMPILGYGGYIPFAMEIFAFYAFVVALLKWLPGPYQDELRIDPDDGRFL